jgi:hypothetical protein
MLAILAQLHLRCPQCSAFMLDLCWRVRKIIVGEAAWKPHEKIARMFPLNVSQLLAKVPFNMIYPLVNLI